jgi:hypothetical protein
MQQADNYERLCCVCLQSFVHYCSLTIQPHLLVQYLSLRETDDDQRSIVLFKRFLRALFGVASPHTGVHESFDAIRYDDPLNKAHLQGIYTLIDCSSVLALIEARYIPHPMG